jgi:DNA-binding MarR family transcriptional regulator
MAGPSLSRDTLGALVTDVSRLMRHSFAERLKGTDMTLAKARALVYVSRNEGIRQVDLADLLEVEPMTLVRLVDQLAAAGLVERRPDPKDRRAYQLFLRPASREPLAHIGRVAAQVRAKALRGVDAAQTEALLDGLRAMRDNLA